MLTGWQIKKGRELLDLSAKALGEATGVGMATVQRAEAAGHKLPVMKTDRMQKLEDYLRERVIFIEADEIAGPGVRLKEKGGENG
jgi:predicted transcriptional regulator